MAIRRALHHCCILLLALSVSACVNIRPSEPPANTGKAEPRITASTAMPAADALPEQSATAPGSRYVFVQTEGGSVFLGPIFGSMNIAANTREMAEKYKDSLLAVDPAVISIAALEKAGLSDGVDGVDYVVKPFVFVQHCTDGNYRMSLVFHVEGANPAAPWVGRYTYHLPSPIPVSSFGNPGAASIARYRSEVAEGAVVLADLMNRDLRGRLPATGKAVEFGSLWLMGSKLGGLGIYTMPNELYFRDVQLIEETDKYVTVRLKGNLHGTVMGGGLIFGVHRFARFQVHTLRPPKAT